MMKSAILLVSAALMTAASASADSYTRALYVKDSDGVSKYSFGVAENFRFSQDGKQLLVKGYDTAINLDKVQYMTFDMPVEGQMSSTAHKDRLVAIGQELNSKIKAYEADDIIGFGVEYGHIDHYDMDAMFDLMREHHPDLFDDDDDDYYARISKALPRLVKAMARIGRADAAAARTIGASYTELFTRNDFKGVFTADKQSRSWKKTADADYFEIRFKGEALGHDYVMRITPSEDYTTWDDVVKIKNEDGSVTTYNVSGQVPRTVTGVVKKDDQEIFSATCRLELNKANKSLDYNIDATAANVRVNDILSLHNTWASDNLVLYIHGEKILTNRVNLTGSELLNVPQWADELQAPDGDYYDSYYNEHYYYYAPDGSKIVRRLGKVVSQTDLLGKLQVKGHVTNWDKSYEQLEEYFENNDDAYVKNINDNKCTITTVSGSEYWLGKAADVINNYSDASFYYDGSDKVQGFIAWNVNYYVDDDTWTTDGYWDDETNSYVEFDSPYTSIWTEYELVPYLMFGDGSSFAFDSDFFTGGNFRVLVNDAESIGDTVENIINSYDW